MLSRNEHAADDADMSEAAPSVGRATGSLRAPHARAVRTVLVVTTCWWPSLARFAQLLQDSGWHVCVLCPPGHAARVAPLGAVFDQDALHPLRALSRAIAMAGPELLLPGDDRAVAHLHRLHHCGSAAERQLLERSLGAPASYAASGMRVQQMAAASAVGLATPHGRTIVSVADLRGWMDEVPGPWVLKADGAWGGTGVRIADHPTQAIAAYRRLRKGVGLLRALKRAVVNRDAFWLGDWLTRPKPSISVQRHIAGQPGNLAMACRDGHMLAAIVVEAVACWGETGPATIVRVVDRPELVAGAARLARHLGLGGFIGLDFMVDAEGMAHVIEMNPRLTSLCNIRLTDGRDVIGAFTRAFLGHADAPRHPATAGLIANFPLAWHWNNTDRRLAECYRDIPVDQPALVAAMLAPSWPDRQLLARLLAAARRVLGKDWRREVTLEGGALPGLPPAA